jgi:flagellar FliL protein
MAKKPKKDGADAASAPAPDGAEPAPGLGRRKLILYGGGGLAALLLAVGGAAWGFGLFRKPPPAPATQAEAQRALPRAHFMDLPELTVNIGSNQPRAQYLRLKLSLELPEAGLAAQIQPVMPRVLDTLQVFLREMRPSDFEGSASVHRMKEELTRRVNLAIQPARIDAVLFREILIQ